MSWVLLLCFVFTTIAEASGLNTIAVLNFYSKTGDEDEDAMLSVGTADTIISDLEKISKLTIVERSRLIQINEEIAYGMSGMIDPSTAQQAGKQVGAEYILTGSCQKFRGKYRVNARLVHVETAKVISSTTVTGKDIFDLQDQIVENVTNDLKISLSSIERKMVEERETKSFVAYKHYSKALKMSDMGNKEAALKEAKRALEYDKKYRKAKEMKTMLSYDLSEAELKRYIELGLEGYTLRRDGVWPHRLMLISSVPGVFYALGFEIAYLADKNIKDSNNIGINIRNWCCRIVVYPKGVHSSN